MLIYIIGAKGWIGQQFINYFKTVNIEFCFSDFRGESKELLDDIKSKRASHVLCCMGRTHGTLNGKLINSVDYLQHNETLQENLNDNLYVPLKLANFCDMNNIHFTYIGTGCIYTYEQDKKIFTESDIPNFFGSNYSIVKGVTNNLINKTNALHLRIRMPITSTKNPRNFITKIASYKKICSVPNSMTVLDEMIPIAVCFMIENVKGVINFTNPGVINHNTILEMYRKYVDNSIDWENMSVETQDKMLLSKRSNTAFDTTKLEEYFTEMKNKYPYLKLSNIQVAVEEALRNYH